MLLDTCVVIDVLRGREATLSFVNGPADALIAATAKVRNLDLATLHRKHFPMFKGLKRPYRP